MIVPAIDKQQVQCHFSGHANEYDLYARVQKRVARRLLDIALPRNFSGPILDVGTGTGEVARRLVELCAAQPVVVSDIAHDMTRTARQHLPASLAVDGDAQALPFRDGCFGLVLSSSVFQWIEDLPAVFAECRRILKPGGLFAFAMFCDGTLGELGDTFRRALEQCGSDWPFHFQTFPQLADVEAAMGAAGFLQRDCHIEMEKEHHPTFRDLMVGLKRIGAQNASHQRPSGLFPRRVMRKMQQIYEEDFQTSEGVQASYGVFYGLAVKE